MEAFQTMTNKDLTVERSVPVAILPEQETPGGSLFLSDLDHLQNFLTLVVWSFDRSDGNMVDVIKQALSKVLVHFYPLAGRLAKNSQGKLTVDCEKKLGVPFVEASANCGIENLGDKPLLDWSVSQELVYRDPNENMLEAAPLLTAQVTKFRCGGFALGVAIHHSIADGSSVMHFMNSWAGTARGRPLSLIPCHDRTILKSRVPPQITNTDASDIFAPVSDVSNLVVLYAEEQMVWKSFHFDGEKLATLQEMATADSQAKSRCSSFVALAAFLWRTHSMALEMKSHQLSKLLFTVDSRSKLKPPVPGYFGNAVVLACCLCTAGELTSEPISSTAGRIKAAMERVDEDHVRSCIDSLGMYQFDLPSPPGSLTLNSLQRFDVFSTDFGWGKARNFGSGNSRTPGGMFLWEGSGRKGIVVVFGLPFSAMNTFEKLVQHPQLARAESPSLRSRARL